jgi:hypothetical protein
MRFPDPTEDGVRHRRDSAFDSLGNPVPLTY